MSLPQHAIDGIVQLLVERGVSRPNALLIVETAHHASTEAIHAVGRVCSALPDADQVAAAMYIALQITQAAATSEMEGLVAHAKRQGGYTL